MELHQLQQRLSVKVVLCSGALRRSDGMSAGACADAGADAGAGAGTSAANKTNTGCLSSTTEGVQILD